MNTIPLVYGIEQDKTLLSQIELSKDIPSECARKLIEKEVDLGLVPVAIIPKLKESHIISDYCIGASGKVKSVLLVSDVPFQEIKEIYLDYQSRTSVNLCKVLCREHWKISPQYLNSEAGFEKKIEGKTAGIIIGDRTFYLEKEFTYQYDLAEEWQKLTGLPFVFAAWVSNKKLPENFIELFNNALKKGLATTQEAVAQYNAQGISKRELNEYLTKYIDFELTSNKREALALYLSKIKLGEDIHT